MAALETANLHLESAVRGAVYKAAGATSYIAQLSEKQPTDLGSESILSVDNYTGAELLGESQAKSESELELTSTPVQRAKLVAQKRVSIELMRKAEANGWDVLSEVFAVLSGGMGSDFDIAATHGTSPKTGNAFAGLTASIAGEGTEQPVTDATLAEDLMDAIYSVDGANVVNGVAVSPKAWGILARATNTSGGRLFPQFGTSKDGVTEFEGVKLVRSRAVGSLNHAGTTNSNVSFIAGDWNNLVFGLDLDAFKTIEFGDPDNTGKDLAGHNQVLVRSEAWFEYYLRNAPSFIVGKTTP